MFIYLFSIVSWLFWAIDRHCISISVKYDVLVAEVNLPLIVQDPSFAQSSSASWLSELTDLNGFLVPLTLGYPYDNSKLPCIYLPVPIIHNLLESLSVPNTQLYLFYAALLSKTCKMNPNSSVQTAEEFSSVNGEKKERKEDIFKEQIHSQRN